MQIIKNYTPYLGSPYLKFEKDPYYIGSSILNKVHLNLGFTKLVSRLKRVESKINCGYTLDSVKKKLIEDNTGLKFETHRFGPNNEHSLEDSVVYTDANHNTTYVGDAKLGWYYYNQNLVVCPDYPHGVAKYVDRSDKAFGFVFDKGYYGYSHRGGQLFKPGDKIFDENWVPNEQDLFDLQKYYVKHLDKLGEDVSMNEWALGYIPFRLRGSETILSMDQAKQAAINMSKYLS